MSKSTSFTDGFRPSNEEEWQQVLASSLNNISLQKKLLKDTYEGFTLKPLYHAGSVPKEFPETGFPGAFPFLRGSHTVENIEHGWKIAQSYHHKEPKEANKFIKEDLIQGVNFINIYFCRKGRLGTQLEDYHSFDELLEEVDLTKTAVGFHSAENILLTSTFFLNYLKQKDYPLDKLKVYFNSDPYQIWAKKGELPFNHDRVLSHMAEVSHLVNKFLPQGRSVGISTSCYHNAGANIVQELSYAIATGLEYLKALMTSGMKLSEATKQLVFYFSFDSQFFNNIAKVRAFRFLWSRVIEELGGEREDMRVKIYGRSSMRMLSLYDPWVNILRTTVGSFSASLAGCSIVETFLFDRPARDDYKEIDDKNYNLARRLSRNIQHILKEESHIHKVIDTAGGSWFVESLSTEYSKAAWENFQEIEKNGGMAEALKKGMIKEQVEGISVQRQERINKRKEVLTGINNYSLSEEKFYQAWEDREKEAYHLPEKEQDPKLTSRIVKASREYEPFKMPKDFLGKILMESYAAGFTFQKAAQILHSQSEKDKIPALTLRRNSQDFESMRLKVEKYLQSHEGPKTLLLPVGEYPQLIARMNYCKNLFEVLGLDVVDPGAGEWTVDKVKEYVKENPSNAYIICGADKEYEEYLEDLISHIKSQRKSLVYVAGKLPEDMKKKLIGKGMEDTIFAGQDALKFLQNLGTKLGVLK
jgi:methylmalonyl-CoA mutase